MSDKLREAAECIESLLELVDDLMPGIANISVPDYAKVNDVPIRARKCLVALADSGTAPKGEKFGVKRLRLTKEGKFLDAAHEEG